jgi:hypothetical protein
MILENIKKILEKEEFECILASPTEQFPINRLLIFLGVDAKERERMLEIIASQQQVSPEFSLPKVVTHPYRLQFRVQLPFKVQDIALNQVASLLLFLNQFIDLPGFELNELEGQVLYRYVWIMQPSLIDEILIMSIIGAIMLNLGMFSDTIESLTDGKMSFNELLVQIISIANPSSSSSSKPL